MARFRGFAPTKDTVEAMLQLGKLVTQLGEVDRVTYHPDGRRRESDTTHTVMLGIIAPALAAHMAPHLDRGLIAELANFHDLPEALVGDVDSFSADEEQIKQKMLREAGAALQIQRQFEETLPYVSVRLRQYREQITPEARWVWAVDKMMPAVTHILNGGTYLFQAGATVEDLARFNAREAARFDGKTRDLPGIGDLYGIVKGLLFEYVYGTEVPA